MTIHGWDASHFDSGRGAVSASAAHAAGISFMTHKATEGTRYTDATFDDHMKPAANVAGLLIGGYHVLHSGNINAQVDHFLSVVVGALPQWQSGPFLVQLDCERWATDFPQRADIKAWCDRFVAVTGGTHQPIVYASRGQYGSTLSGLGYPLWNAAYPSGTARPFKGAYTAAGGDESSNWNAYSGAIPEIWQYTSNATIGSQTQCDANAYRGTLDQLRQLIGGNDMALSPTEAASLTHTEALTAAVHNRIVNAQEELFGAAASNLPGQPTSLGNAGRFAALESAVANLASTGPTGAQVNAAVLAALQAPAVVEALAGALAAKLSGTVAGPVSGSLSVAFGSAGAQ